MTYSQKITLDDKEFSSGMSKAKSVLGTLGSVSSSIFGTMTKSISVASGAMAGLIGYGVKYNAEMEKYSTSFEVMTGSADKAAEVVDRLKTLGAATPFETKDLAETTQLLMNYGFTADTAIDRMSMLGDISQGSADKMNSIATAYGQMSSAGKVQLEDIKQMIEAGFSPLQEISISTGESMSSLYDRISKGAVSVDEITASMQRSTSEGGKYFESMQKQSQTLSGQVSTLKDNFSNFAGVLSGDATSAISKDFLPMLNKMLQSMQDGFTSGGISGLAEAFGNSLTEISLKIVEYVPKILDMGVTIVKSLIQGIQNNLPMIVTTAINIAQTLLLSIFDMLPDILQMGMDLIIQLALGLANALPQLIPQAINCILTLVNTLLDNLDLLVDSGISLIMSLSDGLISALPSLIEKIPEIIDKLLMAISDNLPKIIEMGVQMNIKLAAGLIKAIPQVLEAIPQIITSLINGFANYYSKLSDVGLNLVKGLWNGIKDAGAWLRDKISGFFGGVVDDIKSFFGIHSPSTLFRDEIGQNLALGLGNGFTDGMKSVTEDMQNSIPTTFTTKGLVSYGESFVDTTKLNGSNQYGTSSNTSNTNNDRRVTYGDIYIDYGDITIKCDSDKEIVDAVNRNRVEVTKTVLKEIKKLQ